VSEDARSVNAFLLLGYDCGFSEQLKNSIKMKTTQMYFLKCVSECLSV
jgi:hypothetical protein